jgi:hypothetical protein
MNIKVKELDYQVDGNGNAAFFVMEATCKVR